MMKNGQQQRCEFAPNDASPHCCAYLTQSQLEPNDEVVLQWQSRRAVGTFLCHNRGVTTEQRWEDLALHSAEEVGLNLLSEGLQST